jgi:hypothetical protein
LKLSRSTGGARSDVTTDSGAIAVFANGATTVSSTLTDPAIMQAFAIAVDNAGNVFVNYLTTVAGGGGTILAVGAFPPPPRWASTSFIGWTTSASPTGCPSPT